MVTMLHKIAIQLKISAQIFLGESCKWIMRDGSSFLAGGITCYGAEAGRVLCLGIHIVRNETSLWVLLTILCMCILFPSAAPWI